MNPPKFPKGIIQQPKELDAYFSLLDTFLSKPKTNSPTLLGSWSILGGYSCNFYIDSSNIVHLSGVVKRSGASGLGETILTLPAGYRPVSPEIFSVVANGAFGRVDVLANGNVVFQAGSASSYCSLSGISFLAA